VLEGRSVREEMERRTGRPLLEAIRRVPPASAEEIGELGAAFHSRLGGKPWFTLWRRLDDDASGRISYAELKRGCRQLLDMSRATLPDSKLKSVWRALDEDDSGSISVSEFGSLMKLGKAASERKGAGRREGGRRTAPGAADGDAKLRWQIEEDRSMSLEMERCAQEAERMREEMAEVERQLSEQQARLRVIREAAPPEAVAVAEPPPRRNRTAIRGQLDGAGASSSATSRASPRSRNRGAKAPSPEVLRAYGVRQRVGAE
jgi:hypothetical protein